MSPVTTAVVVPGQGYRVHAPLLFFARVALRRRGVVVDLVDWSPPEHLDATNAPQWVADQVESRLAGAGRPLVVGKSLGSFAAPLVARNGLPAVWFTPLLGQEVVVAALRAATAPALLVGGTDDPSWHGEVARSLSPHVHEVPGGDHSLLVPGPLADSARVLGEVATAVEQFLDLLG
jgi:hypothetical protein